MTITSLVVVAAGKMIELSPGDTLEIQVSFDYVTGLPVVVTLWASLGIGPGRDMESFKDIHLEATTTTKTWSGTTEIAIPASGKRNGTYWMKVEIDGEEVTIQDAVVISGMPTTGIGFIGDMIGMLVLVMMMSMMMNMMKDPLGTLYVVGEKVREVKEVPRKIREVPAATKRAYVEGREG